MTSRSHHTLRLAAPLLWGVGILSTALVVAEGVWELAQGAARPSSAFLATLGDGLDMLAMRLEWVPQFVSSFGATHANNLVLTAVVTSLISCAVAFRKLSLWIRRPGDVIPASRYALQKMRGSGRREAWGSVVSVHTGSPVPFAAVHLLGCDGETIARTIAGPDGSYSFPVPLASITAAGEQIRVAAWRNGWVQRSSLTSHERIALASVGARSEAAGLSMAAHVIGVAAFWGQVAVVPIAYSVQPSAVLAFALAALPICAVLHAFRNKFVTGPSELPPTGWAKEEARSAGRNEGLCESST